MEASQPSQKLESLQLIYQLMCSAADQFVYLIVLKFSNCSSRQAGRQAGKRVMGVEWMEWKEYPMLCSHKKVSIISSLSNNKEGLAVGR